MPSCLADLESFNMTTIEFFTEFMSSLSYKVLHNFEEYHTLKNNHVVVMVKATTFYQIYKHTVFDDERLTMKEFFRVCGQYFYYDKYVCTHGTEYYYYVAFNGANKMFESTEGIVMTRVKANSPATLRDVLHVVEAFSKDIL